ncbi:MAG: hypothetical protein ABSC94_30750 [Polyangiaceae bacterium]|jgi:hypothetical protein
MNDRRIKRSVHRDEALQLLVESVADRSEVRALVLVEENGRVVAGIGRTNDLDGLALTAREVARGKASAERVDAATGGEDVTARSVATRDGMFYFAAMGDRVKGVGDATRALQRILCETTAS